MYSYYWLKKLHSAHYATLLRLAQNRLRYLTGSTAGAETVVQDVFLLAAKTDIRHLENPLGWLINTTVRLCQQRADRTSANPEKQ